jgi:S-adenosylmethionine hydrolase
MPATTCRERTGRAGLVKRTIALITDFGAGDVYAGVVKAVIARTAPGAHVVDLTHDIPRGDVRAGAFALWEAAPYVPGGTVFFAVVDPGVGTSRRPLAMEFQDFFFVGPDNGLFSFLEYRSPMKRAIAITETTVGQVSPTFHGRDVFAPAAARVAMGARLDSLGKEIQEPARLTPPLLNAEQVIGEVLHVDRFGNSVTSIGFLHFKDATLRLEPWIPGLSPAPGARSFPASGRRVGLPDGRSIPLVRTFEDVPEGSPLAYIGSDGLLEIAVNRGNAAAALGLPIGAVVRII